MKINTIYFDGYKNLSNLEIIFEDDQPVNAIIGNNGSGKSNVLEALTIVFNSLGNNENVPFTYEIHYSIDDKAYIVSNKSGLNTINGQKLSSKTAKVAFPRGIFLYYCGETERLKKLAINSVDKDFEKAIRKDGETKLKYISFVGLAEFAPALLANAVMDTEVYKKVCSLMDISTICGKVSFLLKRPSWSKTAKIDENTFWNAQGTVASLLHGLKDLGKLTILDKDYAEIEIDDYKSIHLDAENSFDLFVKLELLIQADILDRVSFAVMKNDVCVSIDELSEGEKQLAQLLCLLEATKEYRALFLLDEFDSFLHPNWQRKFAELVADIDIRGQLLFTTHSPLTLGKMKAENIRILRDGEVFKPTNGTFNRDITEVLEELMGVEKRPNEIKLIMRDFKQAAFSGKKEEAKKKYEELRKHLSDDDPFWIQADQMISRMERS